MNNFTTCINAGHVRHVGLQCQSVTDLLVD